ncbi:MAG: aldo/keto reductase [Patescibacteria group bacterium]|nr:aldo/keto reductase [Patescibacteria group bacterium]
MDYINIGVMQIPTKKLQNGFEMPVFGLGTYKMGEADKQADITAVKTAIELGVAHIDTAEAYAAGVAEKIVGEAIQGYDRSKLFLVSKAAAASLTYAGIKQAVENSLDRMRTDYLDLYLMHRCPLPQFMAECVRAMDELIDAKKVKHAGLSDTNTEHTKQLQVLSKHRFVATQAHYNLVVREVQREGLLDYCQSNDMLLIAWRPISKGGYTKNGMDFTKPGIAVLDDLCQKYHKTPAQIAINWLVSQHNVVTLSKTSTISHLKDNLGAIGWQMDPTDITRLNQEFPGQRFISDTVPLG